MGKKKRQHEIEVLIRLLEILVSLIVVIIGNL